VPPRRSDRAATLAAALADAGGVAAPRERVAQLRDLLDDALAAGTAELAKTRSGYDDPVVVAIAPGEAALVAAAPVAAALRADPGAAVERAWLLVAALVGALAETAGLPAPAAMKDLTLVVGAVGEHLALRIPVHEDPVELAELAALAFEEQAARIDRLRVRALAVPAGVLADAGDFREPIGPDHPLRTAEAIARLGGQPADAASVAEHEEAALAVLEPTAAAARPHEDADPARRVARRIVQRLAGMGKWGGYHTDFAHLARGFAGNDRELATEVGERLLDAGILVEKPSVGQRHVFLNPRRARDVYELIDRGTIPDELHLP
jgi:hypothetical protein